MTYVKIAGVILVAGIIIVSAQRMFRRSGGSQGMSEMHKASNVVAESVKRESFTTRIEAIGTAHANESVNITATVSERIVTIHFENGDMVHTGDVLVELEHAEELANAEETRISLATQKRELERIRALREKQMVSQQEMDNAKSAVDTAAAQLAAAEARLQERSIRAPFSGILGLRQISQGALVSPGTVIITLDDIETIKARFSVPEVLLTDLRIGQVIEAASAAWPGKIFSGTVTGIDSRVNAATRAITIEAQMPNPDLQLRPGMLLTVILISHPRESLAVPETALTAYGKQQYVFVIQPDQTVIRREVKIGEREYGRVEILEGLVAGETFVVEGTMNLKDGAAVRIIEPPDADGSQRSSTSSKSE